jgi:hypothetical protein
MHLKHQLSAPVALVIILFVALTATTLVLRAINSVDFASAAYSEEAL